MFRSVHELGSLLDRATLALGLTVVACGPKEEPIAVPAEPVVAQPVADEPDDEAIETDVEPEPRAEDVPAAAPEPEPIELEPICQAKCDRLKAKCTGAAVNTCREGCEQWTRTHERCVTTAATALTCARDASDLGCAPVAPESCGSKYLLVAQCRENPESFEPAPVETTKQAGLPSGWETLTDDKTGFSIPMPGSATLDTAGERTWRVEGPEGSDFTVRVLAPLPKRPDAKAWIKLASDTLKPCNLDTRLHGLIDKPDFLAMRYDSQCKGSGERHGTLYVLPNAFIVTAIEGPEGEDAEVFLYGLEPKR